MTPETQTPTAARDGFVTYDELGGPDLDAALWSPAPAAPDGRCARPAGPQRGAGRRRWRGARDDPPLLAVAPRVPVRRQPQVPLVGTRRFELPADGPATFAVDLAVENIGGDAADYRRGMAAFHVFDLEVSRRVFAVVGTSTRVFAFTSGWGSGRCCRSGTAQPVARRTGPERAVAPVPCPRGRRLSRPRTSWDGRTSWDALPAPQGAPTARRTPLPSAAACPVSASTA
jgi:hypothetical protein